MFPVLADATVAGADVATVLASLTESGRHLDGRGRGRDAELEAVCPIQSLSKVYCMIYDRIEDAARHGVI